MSKVYDLSERLIYFASNIIDIAEALPNSFAGKYLNHQVTRSGTAPALQYGEAQAAESPADFIHKMKVSLKELRETLNCLRIIRLRKWLKEEMLLPMLDENNQLIAIFVKSIQTAQGNNEK